MSATARLGRGDPLGRVVHFGGQMGNNKRVRARRQGSRVWSPEGSYPLRSNPIMDIVDAAKAQGLDVKMRDFYNRGFWFQPSLDIHGTWNGYNNWYCHCPACTAANTARQQYRRANEGTAPAV